MKILLCTLTLFLVNSVFGQNQFQCPEICRKAKYSGYSTQNRQVRVRSHGPPDNHPDDYNPQMYYYYNNVQKKCNAFYFYGEQDAIDVEGQNRFATREDCNDFCTKRCGYNLGRNIDLDSRHGPQSWGKLGNLDRCPEGEYVSGIQIGSQGSRDINAIRLFCSKPGGDVHSEPPLTSYKLAQDYEYGWGSVQYCDGLLNGFQMTVGGDEGPTNMKVFCSGTRGTIELDGRGGGTERSAQKCLPRQALCAMQLKIDEGRTKIASYANLVQMKMECCDIPNPAETCAPSDRWDSVTSFDNLKGLFPKKYVYKKTIGISHSKESSQSSSKEHQTMIDIGFSLGYEGMGLSANFETKLGTSTTTEYTWSSSTSEVWSEETSHEVTFEVPAKTKTTLYQVVGRCGDISVRSVHFKSEDSQVVK